MPINNKDLAAVAAVLDGSITLEQAVADYSRRQSVIVAITILHANEKTTINRKGEYRELLETLALYPGAPIAGFPRDSHNSLIRPDWYNQKAYGRLVDVTRRLDLHVTVNLYGTYTTVLTDQPKIRRIIAQSRLRKKARELYRNACARREEQLNLMNPDRPYHLMMAELEASPLTAAIKISRNTSVEEIRMALNAAGRILDRHFPEQK
jgi:hypothetical protein